MTGTAFHPVFLSVWDAHKQQVQTLVASPAVHWFVVSNVVFPCPHECFRTLTEFWETLLDREKRRSAFTGSLLHNNKKACRPRTRGESSFEASCKAKELFSKGGKGIAAWNNNYCRQNGKIEKRAEGKSEWKRKKEEGNCQRGEEKRWWPTDRNSDGIPEMRRRDFFSPSLQPLLVIVSWLSAQISQRIRTACKPLLIVKKRQQKLTLISSFVLQKVFWRKGMRDKRRQQQTQSGHMQWLT